MWKSRIEHSFDIQDSNTKFIFVFCQLLKINLVIKKKLQNFITVRTAKCRGKLKNLNVYRNSLMIMRWKDKWVIFKTFH